MLRIAWIQKLAIHFVCNVSPVRWLTIAICLLGIGLLFFSGERVTADRPFNGLGVTMEKPVGVQDAALAADLSQNGALDIVAGEADGAARPTSLVTASSNQDLPVVWPSQQYDPSIEFDNVGVVIGTNTSNTFALEVADLDGDEDLDLVSADTSGSIIAWQNDGTPFNGGWTAQQVGTAYLPVGLAVGDLDRDGDLDLAAAHANGGPTIWRNDGSPFNGGWSSRQVGAWWRTVDTIRIADMNGDGRLDLITGGGLPWYREPDDNNWVTVWYAPQSPFSQSWLATDVDLAYYTVMSLDIGDLDNDGDKDIVIGTEHAPPVGDVDNPVPPEDWPDVYQVRAFRNDGGGSWIALDVGRDPEIQTLALVAYHGYWGCTVTHVALADLDDDGDLDIIATERVEGDFLVMGWQNDGTPFSGELWAPSAIAKGEVYYWLEDDVLWAEAIDFDLDGDLDVASGSGAALENWRPLNLWENTGIAFGAVISETHWLRHNISSRREPIWTVRVADFDQDGDPDLATASHALVQGEPSKIRVWENADFRLDVRPTSQAGDPGETIAYTVTASAWRGFSQPIELWVSGLPAGVEVAWERNPLPPGSSTLLTLEIPPNNPERNYSMGVVGIGGRFVRSGPFSLNLEEYQIYLPAILRNK